MDKISWIYSIIPISAVSNGLGILIPLYILHFNGNVFDIGLAMALFNLILIPSSIFWGYLTNKIRKLKTFILLSLLFSFPVFAILYFLTQFSSFMFLNRIEIIELTYVLFAFIATASSPAINILVIKQRKNRNLPKFFSRYGITMVLGAVIGFAPGILLKNSDIKYYIYFLMLLNLLALLISYFLIEKDKKIYNKNLAPKIHLTTRLFLLLNMLTRIPNTLTSINFTQKLSFSFRANHKRNIYIILLSIALFNFGLNLVNASYIAYLVEYGISNSNIFMINIINQIGQVSIYFIIILFISKIRLGKFYRNSIMLRNISYALILVPIFAIKTALVFNIIAYAIAGFAYAAWLMSSSVMLYRQIIGKNTANYIGVWLAILGISSLAGAFLSGIISKDFGFAYTFVLAIAANIVSVAIFSMVNGKMH
ncbi:MFS transporter [Candidatus Marsarchaeota archaeon]|nr:MFS transporter [Candidatus Marsarchaeota archaeon]